MKSKFIFSGILIIIGLGLFFTGMHISSEVSAGRQKIKAAQSAVDFGTDLSKKNPITKEYGGYVTDPAQKRIDAGKLEAKTYEAIAIALEASGVVIFLVGIGLLFFALMKKKR